ncbi:MAG TPA: hypothetical protein V6C81_11040 [Planktothrix sp.]|jgi:hypothetical protein
MKLPKLISANRLIAAMALAMLAFFTAPAAHAQSACPTGGYTGNYANFNISGTCVVNGNITPSAGDVYFSGSGTLTINGSVTAPGAVTLGATGGTTTVTGAISAQDGPVFVNGDNGVSLQSTVAATSGNLQIYSSAGSISVTGAASSTGAGNITWINGLTGITLKSITSPGQLNVETDNGALNISGATQSVGGAALIGGTDVSLGAVTNTGGWDVRVWANQGSSPTTDPFQIGVTNPANGVLSINDTASTGNAGTIYITNGTGTGNITYSGTNNLQVSATSGQAGTIVLDGRSSSNVTLSGSITATSASGFAGGAFDVFAPALTTNAATLTFNAPSGQNVGVINLITDQITVNTGTTTLSINGAGPYPTGVNLTLNPVGSYDVNWPDYSLGDPITYSGYTGSSNPLAITGAGSLVLNANGTGNGVKIWGYPLTITPASFTINQLGSSDNTFISSWDGGSNIGALTFGGAMSVNVQTSQASDNPGTISIGGTAFTQNSVYSGLETLNASGTNGGAGGSVTFSATSGTVTIGGTSGKMSVTANGSSTGGNGGTIAFGSGNAMIITAATANAVQASALGGTGNGGTITVNAKSISNTSGASVKLAADAAGTGASGGTIDLNLSGSAAETFSQSTNTAFYLEALGSGGGQGGTISVTGGALTVASPSATPAFNVNTAGSNGNGGKITVNSSSLTLSGTLIAEGTGTGAGGIITLSSSGSTIFSGSAVLLDARGNASATHGNDTTINVTASNAITIGTGTGNVYMNAYNPGSGNGGSVYIKSTGGAITANGSNINASAGTGNGQGGSISLNAKTTLTTSGNLNVQGFGSGQGGDITLTAGGQLTGGSANVIADGGSSGGTGGVIAISYKGSTAVTLGTVSAASSTNGGTIAVTNNNNSALSFTATTIATANVASPTTRGTTTFTENTPASDNLTVSATTINTNLALSGDTVSVTGSGASTIGLNNSTLSGNLNLSATATGSSVELLASQTLQTSKTTISILTPTILLDSNSQVIVNSSSSGQSVGFTTNAVTFGAGAQINLNNGSVAFLNPTGATGPMTITVPSGSTTQGVTNATSFIVQDPNGVNLALAGSGVGNLYWTASGTTTTNAINSSGGAITDNGVYLISTNSTFDLGLEGYDGIGSSTSPLLTKGLTMLGTTSSNGGTYVQEAGTQALTIEDSSSSGAYDIIAAGNITATGTASAGSSSPYSIAAGGSLTYGSGATTLSVSAITLTAGSGVLSVANGTKLSAGNGTLLINNSNSTSGSISIGSATLISDGTQASGTLGQVQIAVGATGVETNLDPTDRPAGATVTKNANGHIYWGATPGASVSSTSVTADGNSGTGLATVIISSPSGRSAISLSGATLNAQTF